METQRTGTTIKKTRRMTIIGMLGAISVVLGFTPIGFIPLGVANVTTMHIPVIIGAIMEGPFVGAMVGLIFGISSMMKSFMTPTPISFIFLNPLVSVVPRILIGILTYYFFAIAKKLLKNEKTVLLLSGAFGTLVNTVFVLGSAYALYAQKMVEALGLPDGGAFAFVMGIATTNGIPEMIVAALITVASVTALKKIIKN
ncbi:MAG: ECF transporter S component [Proteocatella sp.]